MSKKQQQIKDKEEARRDGLQARADFILYNVSVDYNRDAKAEYKAKFGSFFASDDLYEEYAILCSELGMENVLDT
jgi:hypothetical protein